jgi:ubiquinone/menaquinone biosynthesis C-methylase UbiE
VERSEYTKMAGLQSRHWWFAAKRRLIANVLRRYVKLGESPWLLEVGCGTGSMISELACHGRAVGLDLYRPALEHVGGAHRVEGNALSLPFDCGAFDLAACFDSLYHQRVDDVSAALSEVARVTRSGGYLLIIDSACPALFGAHDRAHHGARRFSRAGLGEALETAGFDPLHISYFHTAVFPLVALSRLGGGWLRRLTGRDPAPAGRSQLGEVPAPLNVLLNAYYAFEAAAASKVALPCGVSIVAVAERR